MAIIPLLPAPIDGIPKNPQRDNAIRSAARKIPEIFSYFLFFQHAEASALLTPILIMSFRNLINGPVPTTASHASGVHHEICPIHVDAQVTQQLDFPATLRYTRRHFGSRYVPYAKRAGDIS